MVIKAQCPRCAEAGRDTGKNNLAIYADGHVYCYACKYKAKSNTVTMSPPSNTTVVIPPNAVPAKGIPDRGIKTSTTKQALVYAKALLDKDGELVVATSGFVTDGVILFPFYDVNNKLIGIKYRDFYLEIEKGASKNKCIWTVGRITLGGLHTRKPNHTECCIWEGEIDWLTAIQLDKSRDHLFIPGASATSYIKEHASLLRKYRRIYIGFDNDAAGDSARAEVIKLLPLHKLYFLEYQQYNDLNELYLADGSYPALLAMAWQEPVDSLITGKELRNAYNQAMNTLCQFDYISTGIAGIDKMLGGGIVLGELMLLVAHTGVGKSTLCATMVYDMVKHNKKIMWVGTEMQYIGNVRKLIELTCGKKLFKIPGESTWSIPQEEVDSALDIITENVVFYRHTSYEWDDVEEAVLAAIYTADVSVVVIDVLTDLLTPEWGVNERIMMSLSQLAAGDDTDARQPMIVIGVCHTKDVPNRSTKTISVTHLAGGKAVRQKATFIVAMEGDITDENNIRELHVIKRSRMNDGEVTRATVVFNPATRRYEDAPEQHRESTVRPSQGTGMSVRAVETTSHGRLPTRFHGQVR